MKNTKILLSNLCVLCAFCAILVVSTFAQTIEPQTAPFDFADNYYAENGVWADYIVDRRNGGDKMSVFDYSRDPNYRNVRVTATKPAYTQDGSPMYFNHLGDLTTAGFTNDTAGEKSLEAAEANPIYVFPSKVFSGKERQASLLDLRNDSIQLNPLSVRVVSEVEFIFATMTDEDSELIGQMIEDNGKSLDGTPIIRTMENLMELLRRGLVKIKMRGHGQYSIPGYTVAPIMELPNEGAITKDAFLMMVTQSNGEPLKAEEFFVDKFECYRHTMMARRCYAFGR